MPDKNVNGGSSLLESSIQNSQSIYNYIKIDLY